MSASNILAMPAWAVLSATLAASADAAAEVKAAQATFKGAKISVTEGLIGMAEALRDAGEPITFDAKVKTSTQGALYDAMATYVKKPQASKCAQIVCWLATRPELKPLCFSEGKPIGYNKAWSVLDDEINPKGATYQKTLEKLAEYLKDADADTQARFAHMDVEALVHQVELYFGKAREEAVEVQREAANEAAEVKVAA